jgi:hypothetical protein
LAQTFGCASDERRYAPEAFATAILHRRAAVAVRKGIFQRYLAQRCLKNNQQTSSFVMEPKTGAGVAHPMWRT